MLDPPGRGTFRFQIFIQAPSPEIWRKTISGGEGGCWREKWGWPVLGYLLGKNFRLRDRDHLVPPRRMDAAVCRAEMCYSFGREHGRHRAVRRRTFITLLGGTVAAWPLAAHAQQRERMRRIGVLLPATADDPQRQVWFGAFLQGLAQSDWIIDRNVQIDTRWATANVDAVRRHAAELAALAPDVILASGASTVGPLLQATRTVPIVFAAVADPVGAGFVNSLARPGGNATGFMAFEYSISGKWLELLKQIAPSVTRVAVLRDSSITSGIGQFGVIQAMAPLLMVEVSHVNVHDATEIERSLMSFARFSNGGAIITAGGLPYIHLNLIVKLAAQHRLPAVYFERAFVAAGGLISYGPDLVDQFRRAAGYVDRILKGEKPADLPVQAPTKYELVINLKTAKALGLEIPSSVLARADEVIE
jgi:putative tryptophan/tyrosine transport system substrate-binding protein